MASADPITEFLNAVERAKAHQVDTTPVVLATADSRGRPTARLVLLRGADSRGFVFFTNYDSRKGRELTENPQAALCFYWASLDEQIRIEGRVTRVAPEESDEYFAGRPRGSQLGAWASDQSQVLSSRETLENKYREVERRFEVRWFSARHFGEVFGCRRFASNSGTAAPIVCTIASCTPRIIRLAHRASLSMTAFTTRHHARGGDA